MSAPDPAANPHLFGHDTALAAFARAQRRGRLPHGWLLTGRQGVGKATLAFRLARAILENRPADEPQDPAGAVFRMVANRAHPDFQLLERQVDARGRLRGEIVIEQVRAAIERLGTTAAMGGHRVLLADPADLINRNAANAMLKLLEEPPPGLVLLLTVQRPGMLPRTISSRCATLHLRPLSTDAVRAGLAVLAHELDGTRSAELAALAGGSLGRALELARPDWSQHYRALVQAIEEGSPPAMLRLAEQIVARSRDETIEAAAAPLAELLRRAAWHATGHAAGIHLVEGEAEALEKLRLRLGVERLAVLWQELVTTSGRIAALNLDPLATLLPTVEALAGRVTADRVG